MKIYNFKCETYTPFAPYWDYFVGEKISKLDYSDLKEEILRKEQEIISKFKKYDGFIFKPIENNKSSTPISAGMLNIALVSFKSKMLKI